MSKSGGEPSLSDLKALAGLRTTTVYRIVMMLTLDNIPM
ncbi:hypothetical protein UF75_5201 [Desulfosporosinus sp. I2]|nr:hypothetical protein UF75_5201 [Desulfosporosinus sp. I2]